MVPSGLAPRSYSCLLRELLRGRHHRAAGAVIDGHGPEILGRDVGWDCQPALGAIGGRPWLSVWVHRYWEPMPTILSGHGGRYARRIGGEEGLSVIVQVAVGIEGRPCRRRGSTTCRPGRCTSGRPGNPTYLPAAAPRQPGRPSPATASAPRWARRACREFMPIEASRNLRPVHRVRGSLPPACRVLQAGDSSLMHREHRLTRSIDQLGRRRIVGLRQRIDLELAVERFGLGVSAVGIEPSRSASHTP